MINKFNFSTTVVLFLFVLVIITRFTSAFLGGSLVSITIFYLVYLIILIFIGKIKISSLLSKEIALLILLIIYLPVTVIWSDSPLYGLDKAYIFLPLILTSLISAKLILLNFSSFVKIYSYLFILIIIILLFNNALGKIALSLSTGSRFYLEEDEINSSVTIANFFGFSIIILSTFYIELKQKYIRIIILALIFISIVFLFFTGSRGPLVALVCSFLFYKIFSTNKKILSFSVLAIIGFFSTSLTRTLIFSLTPSSMHDFLDLRYTSEQAIGSIDERTILYNSALNGIFEGNILEVLFGHGLGDFSDLYINTDARVYPHNLLLEIGYELGLLSLIVFIYLNIKVIRINLSLNVYNYYSIFIIYYYFLIRSMFTADFTGNYLVFTFMFIILLYDSLFLKKSIHKNYII